MDFPTVDQRLPVKAAAVIYAGAYLEWTSGAIDPVSGAGTFAGVALETVTGGAADGDVNCLVRVKGAMRVNVAGGDSVAITDIGVAATVPEATDDDTIRKETGSSITGTGIGKFSRAAEPGVANGKVDISFTAAHIAA